MVKVPSDTIRFQEPVGEFISFEKIEIEAGTRTGFTSYFCRVKSFQNNKEITLNVQIELPYSDKTLSEIEHEIARAIHEATNPDRLS